MKLNLLDKIAKLVPSIKKPSTPLTFREKLKWTAIVLSIYFLMFSIPAFGVQKAVLNEPALQLVNIIFGARIGTLMTVGIGPIVLSSIVLQLLQGAGVINIDLNDQEQKGKFQSLQKFSAMIIAIIESIIFTTTGYMPVASASYFWIVVVQLAISAIIVIYLDETMVKYGITSGINLFIAGGVAYAIVAGTTSIILPEAAAAIAAGGSTAIPSAILAFGPLFFTALVMLVSIYAYDMKVELPLAFSQFRGVGGRLPIPFLYVSVLPVILATSFVVSATVWLSFLAGVTGGIAPLAHFLAFYQQAPTTTGATAPQLVGGIIYLISPDFPSPYGSQYGGVGGYQNYFSVLVSGTSPLYLPWGGLLEVPNYIHVIMYTVVLVILCIIFGKFWIEMTGQNPKSVSEQLQDVGWQIPGFRRDPRIIENILNKYIPTITTLGSIFVGLLAAVATITGAVGTGVGVLLTVGIMYMVYQQLEQQNMLEGYPALNRLLS